jgi:hypothetical protein
MMDDAAHRRDHPMSKYKGIRFGILVERRDKESLEDIDRRSHRNKHNMILC